MYRFYEKLAKRIHDLSSISYWLKQSTKVLNIRNNNDNNKP